MQNRQDQTTDLIDQLLDNWGDERSDFDASGMAIVGRIIHLASRLKVRAGEALKPFNLPYSEFDVLATLRRAGSPFELMPTQLMESVLLTSGAMTATLRRLEDRDLIERVNDERDKRIRRVRLTKSGLALVDEAAPVRFAEASAATSKLNTAQKKQLSDLLRHLNLNLVNTP